MKLLGEILTGPAPNRSDYAPFWKEETPAQPLKIIGCSTFSLTSVSWDLCLISLDDYGLLAEQISNLAKQSVESNIFLSPEFFRAGMQRVEDAGVGLLCLWEETTRTRILRFFMPVFNCKAGLPRRSLSRNFTHHFAPLGTPLLHRKNAAETVEILLRRLGDPDLGLVPVIAFDQQRLDGKTVAIFRQAATALGLGTRIVNTWQRARLLAEPASGIAANVYMRSMVGRKHHREYARMLRRLSDRGEVRFEIASRLNTVLDALEGFLTLEARGWKGRGGTALYSHKQIVAFSRQAISSLAAKGQCEIHTLSLDTKIIAALICFRVKGEYYTWKIAYDEDYRSYSPGVQIYLQASENWLGKKSFNFTDSLAAANHNMVDHLWRDRLNIGTLLIGTGPDGAQQLTNIASSLERQEKLKAKAKTIYDRLRGK